MLRLSLLLTVFLSALCHAELVISEAKVRLLPPGVPNTSAYFVAENTSESDIVLVSGYASFVSKVELHNHVMKGEVMKMEKQDEVIIAAGESVRFQPGGLHLMLFGLITKGVLKEGQVVRLSLIQKNGKRTQFDATVVMPGQESDNSHHHHH